MKKKDTLEEPVAQDAVSLLKADHRRVKHLFAQFDALKDGDDDDAKAGIVAQVCQELTIHAAIEEEIFYPAVRDAIDDEDQMDEALVEHAGAKGLIAQLRDARPEDPLYDAQVTVLSEQIDHHVAEEEGSMFPKASHAGLDLQALGEKMLLRKAELLKVPLELLPQEVEGVPAEEVTEAMPVPPATSRRRPPAPVATKPASSRSAKPDKIARTASKSKLKPPAKKVAKKK